jgi:hypothetical protein
MAPCLVQYGTATATHALHVQVWCVLSAGHTPYVSQNDWGGCAVLVCAVVCVGMVILGGGNTLMFGTVRYRNCHTCVVCTGMMYPECWPHPIGVTE